MASRLIVPMLLSLAVLGTPIMTTVAVAQTEGGTTRDEPTRQGPAMDPMEQCTFLQNRFDTYIPEHANDPKAEEAKSLRAEGGRLCSEGKSEDGIAKLQQALQTIGVSTVRD